MHQDDGRRKVSHHVEAGRSFFYMAATITATDDDDDDDIADENVGATRWYFGGESFTRVTKENYKKKRERERKRVRRRVSRFEVRDLAHRLLSATSLLLLRFIHPICQLRRKKQSLFVSR